MQCFVFEMFSVKPSNSIIMNSSKNNSTLSPDWLTVAMEMHELWFVTSCLVRSLTKLGICLNMS